MALWDTQLSGEWIILCAELLWSPPSVSWGLQTPSYSTLHCRDSFERDTGIVHAFHQECLALLMNVRVVFHRGDLRIRINLNQLQQVS
jgi:hypothetical protein